MELGFSNKSKVGVKARMTTKMTTMTPKIQTIVFRKCMTLYLKKTFTFEDYKTKYDEKGDDETEEEYHNRCVEIWNNLCDDVKPDKHGEVQFEDDDDDDDEIENEYQDAYFNRIENVVEEHIEKAQEEYEEYNADPLDDEDECREEDVTRRECYECGETKSCGLYNENKEWRCEDCNGEEDE